MGGANRVFIGKLYLCKEKTKSTDSVFCPLTKKIGLDQGESADLWTVFFHPNMFAFFNQVCHLVVQN